MLFPHHQRREELRLSSSNKLSRFHELVIPRSSRFRRNGSHFAILLLPAFERSLFNADRDARRNDVMSQLAMQTLAMGGKAAFGVSVRLMPPVAR